MDEDITSESSLRDINMALKNKEYHDDKKQGETQNFQNRHGLNFDHIYRMGKHRFATIKVKRNDQKELCVEMKCLHCNRIEISGVASELAELFKSVYLR